MNESQKLSKFIDIWHDFGSSFLQKKMGYLAIDVKLN